MSFIDVGFANYMNADKIIEISQVESQPIKKFIKQAKENGRYVDMTLGRPTRSFIYSECGDTIIVTGIALAAPTIVNRIQKSKEKYVQKKIGNDLVQVDSEKVFH